jgi:hypothetical protein
MSFTAKSVIFDIADNWGHASLLGLRSVDFYMTESKIANATPTAYETTALNGDTIAEYVFDTDLSKTGDASTRSWIGSLNSITNQRLIVVFDTLTTFDDVRINNYHSSGGYTERGAKNVVINISSDTITDTTYNVSISNSTKIFDGQFNQHVGSNVEDEQILTLILPDTTVSLAALTLSLSLGSGSIIEGRFATLESFKIGMSLDFGNVTQNIALSSVETGLALDGSPMQSIPVQPFEIGMSIDLDDVSSFETGSAIIRYFCILTGTADGTTDLTLPMASFQARRRSGDPTYLSVVIPTVDYAAQIAARPNGTLKIQQAYEQNGVIKQTETIMETSLDEVNPDEGGTNQSTTLTGYSTSTYSPKSITLSGVTYRSTRGGKYNYRLAKPYIFLNPGDTVTFSDDGVSFVIDTMSYFINPTTSTIELAST